MLETHEEGKRKERLPWFLARQLWLWLWRVEPFWNNSPPLSASSQIRKQCHSLGMLISQQRSDNASYWWTLTLEGGRNAEDEKLRALVPVQILSMGFWWQFKSSHTNYGTEYFQQETRPSWKWISATDWTSSQSSLQTQHFTIGFFSCSVP